jgi:hypothetical protein
MNFPNGVIFWRRAPVRVILTRYEAARILRDQTAHEAMPDTQKSGCVCFTDFIRYDRVKWKAAIAIVSHWCRRGGPEVLPGHSACISSTDRGTRRNLQKGDALLYLLGIATL